MTLPKALAERIRESAKNRCGYCLVPQVLLSYNLEIKHIKPKCAGGSDDEENLWLACRQCNLSKAAKTDGLDPVTFERVKLFNPRQQNWSDHFSWGSTDTEIIGRTPTGRATVSALKMNSATQRTARRFWKVSGVFPPEV